MAFSFNFIYTPVWVSSQDEFPRLELDWLERLQDFIQQEVHLFCLKHTGPMVTNAFMITFVQTRLSHKCQETGTDWQFFASRDAPFESMLLRLVYRACALEMYVYQHHMMRLDHTTEPETV